MIDGSIRAALELHLAALTLATTGIRSDLSVAAGAYRRDAGSFVTEGFAVGDTVLAAGFAQAGNDGHAVVTAVTATELAVDRGLSAEAAGAAASLAAVLPEARKFEGQPFLRPTQRPWLAATLRPTDVAIAAMGGGGLLRHQGSFQVELVQPVESGWGLARIERLAAGLRRHFKPGTALARDGLTVRLRAARRGAIREARDRLSLAVVVDWFCDVANR